MPRIELPEFPVEGGCQCGRLRYRLKAAPMSVYNCHCRDCQKLSGGTHSMSMPVRREDFELLSGELVAFDKSADSGRTVRMLACANCGFKVFNEPLATPHMLVLKPGSLDDPGWAVPVGNIWTDSRLPWAQIDTGLVNFPGQPVDRQSLFDAWAAATRN